MNRMKMLLNNVYENLQKITIPATSDNINIIVSCLNSLKEAYNIIDAAEHGEDIADGTKPKNE